ncbi:MAG TPA: cysteine methyltransferase, partial [Roseiarcus sp.]|nr:cysteine methyltransferase [Roseiarcus sp.]
MRQATTYWIFETTQGFCAIAWSDSGVARFQLPVKSEESAERVLRRRAPGARPAAPPAEIEAAIAAARRYFEGE